MLPSSPSPAASGSESDELPASSAVVFFVSSLSESSSILGLDILRRCVVQDAGGWQSVHSSHWGCSGQVKERAASRHTPLVVVRKSTKAFKAVVAGRLEWSYLHVILSRRCVLRR